MKPFKIHTTQDAPEPVAAILNGTEKALGFVPNLTNNAIGIPLDDAFGPYEWQAAPLSLQFVQPKAA